MSMTLATLEQVLVEIGGTPQPIALGIEDDGLLVGEYGKLAFAGSSLQIERMPKGCTLRFRAANGPQSSFFVAATTVGGADGIRRFSNWLQDCAARAGAAVVPLSPAA